jgi:hypothetical protein
MRHKFAFGEHWEQRVTVLEEFLRHWRAIPRTGLVPRLRDFLDRPNPATQPWTLIFDIMAGDRLPTRLFGSMLVNLVGADLTGTDHLALFPAPQRADFMARHRRLVMQPCGMQSTARAATLKGRNLEMESMALPLMRDDGSACVARTIRVISVVGQGDRMVSVVPSPPQPRWIDIGAGMPAPQDIG